MEKKANGGAISADKSWIGDFYSSELEICWEEIGIMELFVFLVIDRPSFVGYQCNDVKGLSIAWEPRG